MFAVVVAVGPGELEVERTSDLLESLGAYESGPATLVIVDDASEDRDLGSVLPVPAGYAVVSLPHLRRGRGEMYRSVAGPLCTAMLQAFQWIARNAIDDLDFVLKLDTDALVIAPFARKIVRSLSRETDVAMLGAYTRTPNGTLRDISHHARIYRELHAPPFAWRRPGSVMRHVGKRLGVTKDPISRLISHARRNGYVYGEHCLGGAYALSPEFIRRMHAAGHLDDPAMWLPSPAIEDTMVGMYVRAVGMHLANGVDEGDAFGVRYIGLPDTPQRLLSRGYSVIHSVKNDTHLTEDEIRMFFRLRRLGVQPRANREAARRLIDNAIAPKPLVELLRSFCRT